MLALYYNGQRADTLAADRNVRRQFISELAIEPGPELRNLHLHMLNDDPALRGSL